jgi:hypothetical protein
MVDTLQHVLRYVYASRVAQREDRCIVSVIFWPPCVMAS